MKEKREGGEGKGEGKKGSGKEILALPILVCFRRRWQPQEMSRQGMQTATLLQFAVSI